MTLKDVFVADLGQTLEETANIMTDRVILESLAKNGKVSLEEAEFHDALVRRVIGEAAEEFVPDSLPIMEAGAPMILTGEDGTVYSFDPATGSLTPVEGTGGAENNPSINDMGEGAGIQESTEGELTELTESQQIVSNLIKSLGA